METSVLASSERAMRHNYDGASSDVPGTFTMRGPKSHNSDHRSKRGSGGCNKKKPTDRTPNPKP